MKKYKVYSEVLKRPFDSIEELEKAEAELVKKEEEKKLKSQEKKKAADLVQEAYKNRQEVYKKAKEIIEEAKKSYIQVQKEAQELINKADAKYKEVLDSFLEKYDNYHFTINDSNGITTFNYTTNTSDLLNETFEIFNKLFRF